MNRVLDSLSKNENFQSPTPKKKIPLKSATILTSPEKLKEIEERKEKPSSISVDIRLLTCLTFSFTFRLLSSLRKEQTTQSKVAF